MRLSQLLCVRKAPVDFTTYHSGLGKYTTDYSNLPQRYLKRMITRIEWKSPNHPRYGIYMWWTFLTLTILSSHWLTMVTILFSDWLVVTIMQSDVLAMTI